MTRLQTAVVELRGPSVEQAGALLQHTASEALDVLDQELDRAEAAYARGRSDRELGALQALERVRLVLIERLGSRT